MTRAWIALGLYAAYGVVTFAIRSWQHRRATGRSGVVGIRASLGTPEGIGGALFALGALLGGAAPVVALLGAGGALLDPPAWLAWTGGSVAALGIAATYGAQLAMGTSWRIGVQAGERTALVTSGPFRLVRNPIFSCMLLTSTGLLLLLPTPLSLASLLAFLVGIELHVRTVEEPHLRAIHGDAYRDYCSRVGRFVPFVGRG